MTTNQDVVDSTAVISVTRSTGTRCGSSAIAIAAEARSEPVNARARGRPGAELTARVSVKIRTFETRTSLDCMRAAAWLGCGLLVLLALLGVDCAAGYRPVALVHGLLDKADDFAQMVDWILAAHPGTEVAVPAIFCGAESLAPLDVQVPEFFSALDAFMTNASSQGTGAILVCFSQGNLICRSLIQQAPARWNIVTYIAIAGPQLGQFGITSFLAPYLPANISTMDAYLFFYTDVGQLVSVGNYWNDPFEQEQFRERNHFLPQLNVLPGALANASLAAWYRANFERLTQLVLIGGPQDGVITPWQASQFGFFAANSSSTVVPMQSQEVFQLNTFGLATLSARDAVAVFTFPNVTHMEWRSTQLVFETAILPYLD